MEIRTTYICDGAIYCGFKPKGVNVKEERKILYPTKGYELVDIKGVHHRSVWLKDGDSQNNYKEVKIEEESKK